jgi:hypothetical protein
VNAVCEELKEIEFPKPVTLVSLSANPGKFLPALSFILKKYEKTYDDEMPSEDLPRLFSLKPTNPSFK